MNVVFALDSFKGSITASGAVRAVAEGWRTFDSRLTPVFRPMADGGEGTLDAFASASASTLSHPIIVDGPDGQTDAKWLELADGSAVVELASTSGIELLGNTRRPWDAGTTGFGQAIRAALDGQSRRLILGIGSSASTDAGMGMLEALGAHFRDRNGKPVSAGARGLSDIATVDLSAVRPLPPGGVTVLTDVDNPLTGPDGAAHVFGPQKGFAAEDLGTVDRALGRFARLVRRSWPHAEGTLPGTGAAGGTGFALHAWGAHMERGAAAVSSLIGLEQAVRTADLVVTGEGSYDRQSAAGKVPSYVAEVARAAGVPIALVAGRIAADADTSMFFRVVSLTDLAGGTTSAQDQPARWLRHAGSDIARSALAARAENPADKR